MPDSDLAPEEPGPSRDWHAWWRKWRKRRHAWASLAALLSFFILTLLGHSWGLPSLTAAVAAAIVLTVGYFHYRRRTARQVALPTTPTRDDRVIPRDVRMHVIVRDGGKCQLKLPGICLYDKEIDIDHKIPYEWGGSSKDEDNLQCACGPCNRKKSNNWGDTPGGRVTREEYMKMRSLAY